MLRVFLDIFLVILTSAYLFPIEFTFLPGVNTKLILSLLGVLLFLIESSRRRVVSIDKGFVSIILLALSFSLVCLFSVTYNHTSDFTYAFYIISMLVWLFGAYAVFWIIKETNGYISIPLVSNYIIGAAVFQCISALMIEYIPSFSQWVDKIVLGVGFQKNFSDIKGERLYGIGAFLDVAGIKFSCILMIIAVLCTKIKVHTKNWLFFYAASFILLATIGNMMSRTTIVGLTLAVIYIIYKWCIGNKGGTKFLKYLTIVLLISIPIIIYLYNNNTLFYNKFRFGFEGFFSWIEHGEWQTNSNDKLQTMFKLPDNLKTWIIGDGYFEDVRKDPYYIGYNWLYFYMGTDVGYSRFLFYCGITGLLTFCFFLIGCTIYLIKLYPTYKMMFLMILCINFIVWFKVSSDCFSLFAAYLACAMLQNKVGTDNQSSISETLEPHLPN